ncbi:YajQ family cyclic di-GMP-binding protein [Gynuella sp.]|uniref:YajQ family cyclic di-GMP-binding protein n=1 Tax=Gynuella sp. TaxID=2969146 RepID=UPI003D108CFB
MPSFDVVSEVDKHELTNAVDQARRVVETRFDFKGVEAEFELQDGQVILISEADIQIRQMKEIIEQAFIKRGIEMKCLDWADPAVSGQRIRLVATIKQGIDKELGKKIVKLIKDSKIKVQAAIQGDQVRVTGKKRDDLQQVMSLLRESELELPLQFNNFRD